MATSSPVQPLRPTAKDRPANVDIESGDYLAREEPWVQRYELLKSRGYLLRPRYRPGWTPPWLPSGFSIDYEERIGPQVSSTLYYLPS